MQTEKAVLKSCIIAIRTPVIGYNIMLILVSIYTYSFHIIVFHNSLTYILEIYYFLNETPDDYCLVNLCR